MTSDMRASPLTPSLFFGDGLSANGIVDGLQRTRSGQVGGVFRGKEAYFLRECGRIGYFVRRSFPDWIKWQIAY
ncbi:MAG TPA: hypothetical protein VKR55_24700 [Bradyrhizobium sp.]|uniref:hypothetical protein n=1 Tax=Bradyrhizobium sp. TaxID=376 RepID=UPI002B86E79C|nr:hypothetical protein [Bradyrhizobium sp.]HLZ05335.1 hypothetical protein [Bradyrhizobium sp.]